MENKEIFENRAKLNAPKADINNCDNCDNPVVFALKDNYHTFSLDLITVLKCLKMAEQENVIPELPGEWWNTIKITYKI